MNCLICGNERARILASGVWMEFHCPECGTGRVTIELLSLMMLHRAQFDVTRSREWIAERRRFDPLPVMNAADLSRVIAPRQQ